MNVLNHQIELYPIKLINYEDNENQELINEFKYANYDPAVNLILNLSVDDNSKNQNSNELSLPNTQKNIAPRSINDSQVIDAKSNVNAFSTDISARQLAFDWSEINIGDEFPLSLKNPNNHCFINASIQAIVNTVLKILKNKIVHEPCGIDARNHTKIEKFLELCKIFKKHLCVDNLDLFDTDTIKDFHVYSQKNSSFELKVDQQGCAIEFTLNYINFLLQSDQNPYSTTGSSNLIQDIYGLLESINVKKSVCKCVIESEQKKKHNLHVNHFVKVHLVNQSYSDLKEIIESAFKESKKSSLAICKICEIATNLNYEKIYLNSPPIIAVILIRDYSQLIKPGNNICKNSDFLKISFTFMKPCIEDLRTPETKSRNKIRHKSSENINFIMNSINANTLNLESFQNCENLYTINSVVCYEKKKDIGHYFAICKFDSKWFIIDDEKKQEINQKKAASIAYNKGVIIYYIRENDN